MYLEKLQHYSVMILQAYADPTVYDDHTVQHARMEIRLARSNFEASIERALHEPGPYHIDPDMTQGLQKALATLSQHALALEAYLGDNPTRHTLPEMRTTAQSIDEAFRSLVATVHGKANTGSFPHLQSALEKLKHAPEMEAHAQKSTRTELHLIFSEVKGLVRSLEMIHYLFSSQERPAILQQT